jgi:hypothetical protein
MHVPINVKSPNNISKWQMGFNLAFKGLMQYLKELKLRTHHIMRYLTEANQAAV